MVCQPEHQSAEELTEALQASRGAISMAMQMLQGVGAVERLQACRHAACLLPAASWFLAHRGRSQRQARGGLHKLMARGLELMDDLQYALINTIWQQRQANQES
jgi:hypothetical protein